MTIIDKKYSLLQSPPPSPCVGHEVGLSLSPPPFFLGHHVPPPPGPVPCPLSQVPHPRGETCCLNPHKEDRKEAAILAQNDASPAIRDWVLLGWGGKVLVIAFRKYMKCHVQIGAFTSLRAI